MNMVKVVRIDGKNKPVTDFKGNVYHPETEKVGTFEFPVFTFPEDFARHMVSQRPQWYKLFDSKPLSCPVDNPGTGTRTYVVFNPWKVKTIEVPIMKDGKATINMEKQYKWVEDIRVTGVFTEPKK